MRRRLATAGLAAGALLLAACSNAEPPQENAPQEGDITVTAGPDGVQEVTIDANDQYRFVPARIHVTVGRVRIVFRDVGNTPHNLVFGNLADAGRKVAARTIRGGAQTTLDFRVNTPGEYRFVCTIHESLNQTGVLVVTR